MRGSVMVMWLAVAPLGCWPDLEPQPVGAAEDAGLDAICELQSDCLGSAEMLVCVAEGCLPPNELPCEQHADCGAMGWCWVPPDESVDSGCMPEDKRHCRSGAEVLDCTATGQLCCEQIEGEDWGAHECRSPADCQPETGWVELFNPKSLK